jgi:flagellar biosynthesis protein FlhB
MSDAFDDGQKTEDPSARKLQRARSQGQVAHSREINTWFMLAAGAGVILFLGPALARSVALELAAFADPARFLAEDGVKWNAVLTPLRHIGTALLVPAVVVMAAALAGNLVQNGLVFATEKIGFNPSHISPIAGFSRLFSFRAMFETLKSLAKVMLVMGVAAMMMRGELDRISLLSMMTAEDIAGEIERLVLKLLLGVLMALSVLAGLDYFYQRLNFLRSLRMSKREVKEENKQSEGDPLIKGRLRQIRMERARRRMMAAVPKASVVITNPTHFAVALKYEMGAAGAPRVVAKGKDLIALRIRDLARENDVPVVENPPLARALHAGVELDHEIPPEHYKAVAEIISYVFRLKGKIRRAEASQRSAPL